MVHSVLLTLMLDLYTDSVYVIVLSESRSRLETVCCRCRRQLIQLSKGRERFGEKGRTQNTNNVSLDATQTISSIDLHKIVGSSVTRVSLLII